MRQYKTVMEAYNHIHYNSKMSIMLYGATTDKSNREATKLAIAGAWKLFNRTNIKGKK